MNRTRLYQYFPVVMAAVAAIMLGLGLAYFVRTKWPKSNPFIPVATQPTPTPAPPRTERNYLLLGYGGNGHAGGKLTDTIMLAAIRPELKRIALISLPRDLWVTFPVNSTEESGWKLNAAYALGADDRNYPHKLPEYSGPTGGGKLAAYTLKKVTGLDIDRFVAVDFATFTRTVDRLGGIDVRVEKTFDDYQYPIEGEEENTCGKSPDELAAIAATASAEQAEPLFGCRYEHLHFDKGANHMDGATALKFARSRHSVQDGNDFGRSNRQKLVLLAVKEKLLDWHYLPQVIPLATDLLAHVDTNFGLGDIQEIIGKKDEYSSYEVINIALTDKNVLHSGRSSTGAYVLLPNAGENQWEQIHQFIEEQIATKSATLILPTPSPKASSSASIKK